MNPLAWRRRVEPNLSETRKGAVRFLDYMHVVVTCKLLHRAHLSTPSRCCPPSSYITGAPTQHVHDYQWGLDALLVGHDGARKLVAKLIVLRCDCEGGGPARDRGAPWAHKMYRKVVVISNR